MILTQTLTLTLACSVHFQKINHCKLLIIIHNLIICHWHDVNVKQQRDVVLGEAVCLPPFPPPNIHAQDVEFVPCTAEGSWRRSLFHSHLSRRRRRSSSVEVAGLEVIRNQDSRF